MVGSNARLHSIQAAILGVKLQVLDEWNEERRKLAQSYAKLLAGLPIMIPQPASDVRPVYHLYVIRTQKRDALKSFLSSQGVDTAIHYPTPVHLQLAYTHLGYKQGDFPFAENWADDVLSLPMFVGLRQDEIEYVAHAIRTFFFSS
jgi:dTDP-4-amino-4,6-dideoxygalactose transaminase